MKYLVRIRHLYGVKNSDEQILFNDETKARKHMLDESLKIIQRAKSNNNKIIPLQPYYWSFALGEKNNNGIMAKHYIWLEVF